MLLAYFTLFLGSKALVGSASWGGYVTGILKQEMSLPDDICYGTTQYNESKGKQFQV